MKSAYWVIFSIDSTCSGSALMRSMLNLPLENDHGREGCPLSPYVSIIAMSACMADVHRDLRDEFPQHRWARCTVWWLLTERRELQPLTGFTVGTLAGGSEPRMCASVGLESDFRGVRGHCFVEWKIHPSMNKAFPITSRSCDPLPKMFNWTRITRVSQTCSIFWCRLNMRVMARQEVEARMQ